MVRRARAVLCGCSGRVLRSLPRGLPRPGFRSAAGGEADPGRARGAYFRYTTRMAGLACPKEKARRWPRPGGCGQRPSHQGIEVLDGGWGDWILVDVDPPV